MLQVLIKITLMSTHKFGFNGELTKFIFQLLSNTQLICSTVTDDDDDFSVSSIMSGLKTRSLGLNTLGTSSTVTILNFRTDRSGQTVQTKIRLLLGAV